MAKALRDKQVKPYHIVAHFYMVLHLGSRTHCSVHFLRHHTSLCVFQFCLFYHTIFYNYHYNPIVSQPPTFNCFVLTQPFLSLLVWRTYLVWLLEINLSFLTLSLSQASPCIMVKLKGSD